VQGMHAHVGVAAIQENGAAALWSLTADGALWHHCWWRCVVRGACRAAAGWCVLLVGVPRSATCTRSMQIVTATASHPCGHLLLCVVVCWILAMWAH